MRRRRWSSPRTTTSSTCPSGRPLPADRGGEPSRDLLRLMRPELRLDLRTALHQAARERRNVEVQGVPSMLDDGDRARSTSACSRCCARTTRRAATSWSLFDDRDGGAADAARSRTLASPAEPLTAAARRGDRRGSRQQLRTTIEQYETQVEEAKASNEELQAMNEELRSSAEELETSKEELQSVNEELTTVNQELRSRSRSSGSRTTTSRT